MGHHQLCLRVKQLGWATAEHGIVRPRARRLSTSPTVKLFKHKNWLIGSKARVASPVGVPVQSLPSRRNCAPKLLAAAACCTSDRHGRTLTLQ